MTDWHQRFMGLAKFIAAWSKDPSTKCGAVIVNHTRQKVAYGYNGFPIGVNDTMERYHNREVKYALVVHAEVNAILNAQFDVTGCTLYTYPLAPCPECAKAVIQSGISNVYSLKEPPARPKGSIHNEIPHPSTALMFAEARVVLHLL
jgi:dCMP deaminase